ncbi:MAG: hypothetical protein PUH44_07500, partial [Bacteroidales bacterium]|nr:hypothetical protein [Bacteroidales bacterium]MDY2704521.1 hypothetical protein [Alloprevotella sp.]
MTIYFLGGSAGTFVSGLFWQHYGWAGVVGVGVAFTVASLFVNCFQPSKCFPNKQSDADHGYLDGCQLIT